MFISQSRHEPTSLKFRCRWITYIVLGLVRPEIRQNSNLHNKKIIKKNVLYYAQNVNVFNDTPQNIPPPPPFALKILYFRFGLSIYIEYLLLSLK